MQELETLKSKIDRKCWELEQTQTALDSMRKEVIDLDSLGGLLDKSSIFFRLVFDKKKDELRTKIEKLANYGLEKIFGDDIRLKIEQKIKNNRVSNEVKVQKKFDTEWVSLDVMDAEGGGMVDVVSFLMRVIVMCLMVPRPRRLLVLDEFAKHLSADFRPKVASFMKELTEKLGVQIILVTHALELTESADVVYNMSEGKIVE